MIELAKRGIVLAPNMLVPAKPELKYGWMGKPGQVLEHKVFKQRTTAANRSRLPTTIGRSQSAAPVGGSQPTAAVSGSQSAATVATGSKSQPTASASGFQPVVADSV